MISDVMRGDKAIGVPSPRTRTPGSVPDDLRTIGRTTGRTRPPSARRPDPGGPGATARGAALLLVLAWPFAACTPSVELGIPPFDADHVLIGAVLRFDLSEAAPLREVLRAQRLEAGERMVIGGGGLEAVLSTWRLERAGFLDPRGQPLPDAAFDALVLRAAAQPPLVDDQGLPVGCGRCLAPTAGPGPQLVHAGSSCPPPVDAVELTFATATGVEIPHHLRTAALDQIRFVWPGDCACPLEDVPSSNAPDARPELRAVAGTALRSGPPPAVDETAAHRVLTESAGGVVGLFDESHSVLVGPSGTATVSPVRAPGYVAVAVALTDSEHLIGVVQGSTREFALRWYRAEPGLAAWTELPRLAQPQFEPWVARAVPERPGHFLIGGVYRGATPETRVLLCATRPERCEIVVDLRDFALSESFAHLLPLEDRSWLAVTDHGTVTHLAAVPDVGTVVGLMVSTEVQARPDGAGAALDGLIATSTGTRVVRWRALHVDNYVLTSGARYATERLRGAAVVGDRLYLSFASLTSRPADQRELVVTRTFARSELALSPLDPLPLHLGFEVLACRPSAGANSLALVTTGTVVHGPFADGRELRFDRDGPLDPARVRAPACEPTGELPLLPPERRFSAYVQTRPDRWLGLRGVVDVASGAPGRPLRWVYGGPVPAATWSTALAAPDAGGAWLLGPAGQLGWLPAEGSALQVQAVSALAAPVRDAALDSAAGPPGGVGLVVIDARGEVGRLVVQADGSSTWTVLEPAGPLTPSAIAEVAPGLHVLIAGSLENGDLREVWRIQGDAVDRLRVPEDDPLTPAETESSYRDDTRCTVVRRATEYPYITRNPAGLRALAVSQGVAWVAGCGAELLRVTAPGPALRVDRFSYTRDPALSLPVGAEVRRPYDLTAVTALCSDHLLLGGRETTSNATGASNRFWELRPSGRVDPVTRLDADLRVRAVSTGPVLATFDLGDVLAVVPARPQSAARRPPWLVLSSPSDEVRGTVGAWPSAGGLHVAGAPQSAIRLPDGRLLVTLEGGAVLVSAAAD